MSDNSAVFAEVEKFLRAPKGWQDSKRFELLRIMRDFADNELETRADRDRAAELTKQLENLKAYSTVGGFPTCANRRKVALHG